MSVFYRIDSVPTNSCILMSTPEAAKAWPRGRVELAFCNTCGFICNLAFDQALTEYSERYEETQGFSPTFQTFHRELAAQLVERHDLHKKKIVEIGCGKGEFLHLLCALGDNQGLGFDPSYIDSREQSIRAAHVEFVADYFSSGSKVDSADFVACKMTLEHIPDTLGFVRTIREAVHAGPDAIVFIQVPEATRILEDCAFEDIYYEHCSYFVPASLSSLLERTGFHVIGTDVTYDNQYLTAEASFGRQAERRVDDSGRADMQSLRELVRTFPGRVSNKIDAWRSELAGRIANGQTVVVWGSGSKGVSFLTSLGLNEDIRHVVDINPNRHGYYLPGTGQRIISPNDLVAINPDCVVVMNSIYRHEVEVMLSAHGMHPELLAL